MPQTIRITTGGISLKAELNDSPCAMAVRKALPIRASADTWGQEVYFDIGVKCGLTGDARDDMQVGEIGYWPTGRAFCLFFGRTPASGADGKPKAASKVNVIGRVLDDAKALSAVRDGDEITLTAEK